MDTTDTDETGSGANAAARLSGHEAKVTRYYSDWDEFYRQMDGFHVMLFDPGQAPDEKGVPLTDELRVAGWQRLTDAVTEPIRISSGDHVVDAGCGFGAETLYLASKHGCRATGISLVNPHLELAKERARKANLAGLVDFRWANCSEALPFEDASVDVVVCMEAACHFRDRTRFLHEVARILRPGGRLAIEDFMQPEEPLSEECRGNVELFCRGWSLHSLESRGSYTRKLDAVGLELLDYAGFDGADAYNIRLAEAAHRRSVLQMFSGGDQGPTGWHDAWAGLALAWRQGHILHERLLARKP